MRAAGRDITHIIPDKGCRLDEQSERDKPAEDEFRGLEATDDGLDTPTDEPIRPARTPARKHEQTS